MVLFNVKDQRQTLMSVLKKRIALLLKDKEESAMTAAIASSWLSNEAASFEAICRAGTFRYLICTQYVHNMYTVMYTICTQYVHNMYTICTQYVPGCR